MASLFLLITHMQNYHINAKYMINTHNPGADPGGVHPARAPPKIGKNMIFLCKIMIFHTKYPKTFRASLRSAPLF